LSSRPARESGGPNYQVRALDRALDILDSFSLQQSQLSLTEIAERGNLPLSTAKRLVSVLEERGFLEQVPESDTYRIGIRAFEVGSIYIQSTTIEAEAHPSLERLAQKCQQTANLGVMNRGEVVHIAVVAPDRPIRYFARLGEREQAYYTGLGKALLSDHSDEELDLYASSTQLVARTRRTITTPELLKMHIQEVRQRGFAMDDEESVVGLRCIAAPIRNAKGEIVAAVSISGASFEFSEDVLADYIESVKAAASEISTRLGYNVREP
jgi:IclR family transcriptional regulator, KDG regulon repressor